jgi:hypothetical protein
MKNRHEFLHRMILLALLIFFSIGVYAQAAKDPQRDLTVSFSSKHEGADSGSVFGVVRNSSANPYPCVRLEFNLSTRFDLRPPGEESRHLGVLPVEVLNLQPRTARDYEERLPFPAGIGLKSVSECPEKPKRLPDAPEILSFTAARTSIHAGDTTTLQWRTANSEQVFFGERNPEWPKTSSETILMPRDIELSGSLQVNPPQTVTYVLEAKKGAGSVFKFVTVEVTNPPTPPATCSITGQVFGKLTWKTVDDRGNPISPTLTHIEMKVPGASQSVAARIQGRRYIFRNVPAGKTYRIFPGFFRAQPQEIMVFCQPNTPHTGIDFVITRPPLQG